MSYVDAIAWFNKYGILYEPEDTDRNAIGDVDGKPAMVGRAIGDDIAEAAERQISAISEHWSSNKPS